jgi:hypothetical protein
MNCAFLHSRSSGLSSKDDSKLPMHYLPSPSFKVFLQQ